MAAIPPGFDIPYVGRVNLPQRIEDMNVVERTASVVQPTVAAQTDDQTAMLATVAVGGAIGFLLRGKFGALVGSALALWSVYQKQQVPAAPKGVAGFSGTAPKRFGIEPKL